MHLEVGLGMDGGILKDILPIGHMAYLGEEFATWGRKNL